MLEPRPQRYHISDGDDAWGVVITRKVMPGVQLWYSANKGKLTLGLTTPATQRLLRPGAVPEGATKETSATGWTMFRWDVPVLELEKAPEEQAGSIELLEKIKAAFDWFNANRIDLER
ncbi:MAG: hypothetical protein ACK4TJ_12735 [Tabrizicola sp.]